MIICMVLCATWVVFNRHNWYSFCPGKTCKEAWAIFVQVIINWYVGLWINGRAAIPGLRSDFECEPIVCVLLFEKVVRFTSGKLIMGIMNNFYSWRWLFFHFVLLSLWFKMQFLYGSITIKFCTVESNLLDLFCILLHHC